jgi:hypothetical protein
MVSQTEEGADLNPTLAGALPISFVDSPHAPDVFADLASLIDTELTVFQRNREHLIYLPEALRDGVRQFLNEVSIKKAVIAGKLGQFYQLDAQAKEMQAGGHGPEAGRKANEAIATLAEAQKAADKLAVSGKEAKDLLDQLDKLKPSKQSVG